MNRCAPGFRDAAHKIFGVSVNVINNLMSIYCFLIAGSVLSNDFPLIIIIIGNVLRLRDGIRSFTTERISKSRTMDDQCYMGRSLSALLLSQPPTLEFYLINGRRYGAQTFTTEWNAFSPALASISWWCSIVLITGQLALLIIRSTRHHGLSETQIKMCQAQIKKMEIFPSKQQSGAALPSAEGEKIESWR